MSDTITIANHEYGVEGATLIAERYDDGMELHVGPVFQKGTDATLSAWFVLRGPRGGLRHATVNVRDAGEVAVWQVRLAQAGHHLYVLREWKP